MGCDLLAPADLPLDNDRREMSNRSSVSVETQEDRVTMAEAARLKGVSYHTVSRAVRKGKLPVLRLGRMALISRSDLQSWQPMKERAPRKYRRASGKAGTSEAIQLMNVDHLEVVHRLGAFCDLVYTMAEEQGDNGTMDMVVRQIASMFAMDRVIAWHRLPCSTTFQVAGSHNYDIDQLPETLRILDNDLVAALREQRVPMVVDPTDRRLRELGLAHHQMDGPVLVVPIMFQDDISGVLVADRGGDPLELTPDELALCAVTALQLGILYKGSLDRMKDQRDQARLHALLDEGGGGVCAFDERGLLVHINEAERELFGLQRDKVKLGMSLETYMALKRRRYLSGHTVPSEESPIMRAMRGERVNDVRQIVERPDGSRRYITTSAHPILIDCTFAGAISTTQDITEEREAERSDNQDYLGRLEHALRRSEMIADVVMGMNVLGSELDLDSLSMSSLDRICTELGADGGTIWRVDDEGACWLLAGWNVETSAYRDRKYQTKDFAFAAAAFTGSRPVMRDVQGLRARTRLGPILNGVDGLLQIPMRVRGELKAAAILTFAEFQTLDEADAIFASVWARQYAQRIDAAYLYEQLASVHDRLVGVVDQMSQAVVITESPSGQVLVANEAAEALWQLPIKINSHVDNLRVLNGDREELAADDHPLLAGARAGEVIKGQTLYIPRPEGEPIEVLATHSPYKDLRGNVLGCVSVLQERADFKAIDRSKDEFISVVAHELRNPLTALRGNLQLLQRRVSRRGDDDSAAELDRIETAIVQVDRVADLVSRMLDVSRVDMNSLDVTPHETDAASIINEAVAAVRSGIPASSSQVLSIDAPDSIPVEWDAARIHQVISNLLQNAFRYAPDKPIELRVEDLGDEVAITVRDHGPGISHAMKSRLFKQYYRFDDGDSEQAQRAVEGSHGLGIGLYVSARLVRQHGGTITVDDAEGGGAEFTVRLPKVVEQALVPQA